MKKTHLTKYFINYIFLLLLMSFTPQTVQGQLSSTYLKKNKSDLLTQTTCDSLPVTFQKVLELTDDPLFTYDLLTYPNGDYLAVGSYGTQQNVQQAFLVKFSPSGKIHWAKEMGAFYPPDENIIDWYNYRNTVAEQFEEGIILEDSTAIMVGERYGFAESRIGSILLVKIDFNGNILWSKYIDNTITPFINRLNTLGISPADESNFFIFGTYEFASKSFILKLNSDGEIINSKSISTEGSINIYPSVKKIDNELFIFGRCTKQNVLPNKSRAIVIGKTDYNLNTINTVAIHSNNSEEPYISGPSSFYWGVLDSTLYIPYNMVGNGYGILAIDRYFNFIFNKEYEGQFASSPIGTIIGIEENGSESLIASFGRAKGVSGWSFYMQPNPYFPIGEISPTGEILSLNIYGSSGSSAQVVKHTSDQGLMLAGQTNNFGVNTPALTIMRIDSTSTVSDCPTFEATLTTTDKPVIIDTLDIQSDTFPFPVLDFFLPTKTLYPVAREVCCDALPDATVQWLLPAYTCGDSIGLDISICNVGPVHLAADFPITIYSGDPQADNATVLSNFPIGTMIPSEDCYQFTYEILNTDNTRPVFLVLGDNAMTAPIETPCDFPLDGLTEECDYYNNFKSVTIPDTTFTTRFQDDYFQNCNEDVILVAPYYVQNPVWNDTIINDTMIAPHGGWYYLRGTTPCGGVFLDSVEVIEQHPHLPYEIDTICQYEPLLFSNLLFDERIRLEIVDTESNSTSFQLFRGDSITYIPQVSGDYFVRIAVTINQVCSRRTEYNIHVSPAPNIMIDTTLCAGQNLLENQTFTLTTDTLLSFSYPFSESCDSTRQYQVSILDTSYQEITLTACAGDSILFQNTPIAAGDNQIFVHTGTNGCDSTLFVSVSVLEPSPTTEVFLEFCRGDSILIFGENQQNPGFYSNTFINTNGCDSLVEIMLTELPVFQSESLVSICSGASVLIHGQSENQAGFYEAVFTAENGCDSIAFVELELFATVNLEAEISPSCTDETTGGIVVNIIEGDGPFSFVWSDINNSDTIRQNLAPGSYTLTLTDTHGCTSLHGYSVPTLTGEEDCAPRWYAPNAFSPNNDGRNDRFTFYANTRMDRIELLEIFDRWGNLVFRVENIPFDEETLGWDGLLKGQPMNPQVFAWRAVVVDRNGNKENASGDVTLMR